MKVGAAYLMVTLSLSKRQTARGRWISTHLDSLVLGVHWVLGIANAFGPILWVWHQGRDPLGSMVYLGESVVLWMKMISYAHVNRDSRKAAYVRLVVDRQQLAGAALAAGAVSRSEDSTDADFTAMRDIEKPFIQVRYDHIYVCVLRIRILMLMAKIILTPLFLCPSSNLHRHPSLLVLSLISITSTLRT